MKMPGEKRPRNDYELGKEREIIYFSRDLHLFAFKPSQNDD
jgi:hypothetical protein